MECIDGPALSHALPPAGFPPARAFALSREIAVAVAHAHEPGVIHRDLKPGNILLAPDGKARVANFWLARPVHERVQHLSLTHTGLIAGTAEYLPPEVEIRVDEVLRRASHSHPASSPPRIRSQSGPTPCHRPCQS